MTDKKLARKLAALSGFVARINKLTDLHNRGEINDAQYKAALKPKARKQAAE